MVAGRPDRELMAQRPDTARALPRRHVGAGRCGQAPAGRRTGVAPPVSAVKDPTTLWHAENVSIGDVLAALDEIRRRFAHQEAEEGEHPHPRNCVMTLISVAPT